MSELPGVFGALAPYLEDYGYLAVALFVLLENVGFPMPGEATLVTAALFTVSGRLDVSVLVVVAFSAAVVGDNLGYALGRFGGRPVVMRFGRRVGVIHDRLDRVDVFFGRHGGKVVVAARFLPLLRHLNGVCAGVSHMPWRRFLGANATGAGIWVVTWTAVGVQAGGHIDGVNAVLTKGTPVLVVLLGACLVAVAVRRRARRRRSRIELLVGS